MSHPHSGTFAVFLNCCLSSCNSLRGWWCCCCWGLVGGFHWGRCLRPQGQWPILQLPPFLAKCQQITAEVCAAIPKAVSLQVILLADVPASFFGDVAEAQATSQNAAPEVAATGLAALLRHLTAMQSWSSQQMHARVLVSSAKKFFQDRGSMRSISQKEQKFSGYCPGTND